MIARKQKTSKEKLVAAERRNEAYAMRRNGASLQDIATKLTTLYDDWVNGGRLDNILDARASATNVSDAQTAIIAQVDANEAKIDTGNAILAKIDSGLEPDGSGGYQGTSLFLENAPSGSGLTAQQTRDAMKLAPSAGAAASGSIDDQLADIPAALFTSDTGETYATSVAGSVVKEIADNAGVGAIENTVVISASAPSLTAINSGGMITIHRGDLTSFQLTDLGSLVGRTGEKIYFTVKAAEYTAASVDDTVATIQVTETTGATRLNGEATTASYGAITVNDPADGDITISLQHQLTTALPIADGYYYDVQLINSAGKPVTLTKGLLNVNADVTRSTS